MFIDIDYNKRKQKARFHLAKPNQQVISPISEKFKDDMSLKLGNISELNFSIPHYIEDENTNEQVYNLHVDLIKERMLIKVTLGTYVEWYVVDSIEEDGEDSEIFNVKAFSLGYELKGKRISELNEDSINATELLQKLLEQTIWEIGEVDDIFNSVYRSFESGSDSNVLDCITQVGETFGALIVWDTVNRKVSLKDMTKNGKFRGMTVNYGRFLRSIKRTRTTDEMVTRLHVTGNEGLSIHAVNPTGQGYLEDFSYFMYPFQRDSKKVTIQSSFFMSDDLCHAILNQQELLQEKSPAIKDLTDKLLEKQTKLVTEESNLTALKDELKTLEGLLDTAKAVLAKLDESKTPQSELDDAKALVNQRNLEVTNKQSQIASKELDITNITTEMNSFQSQIDALQNQITVGSGFTPQLLKELNLYIIEKEWSDDKYINDLELYEDAVKKFTEIRQPKVVIEVSIDNLMNIIEEQYYWDKLVLGDLIKVKYPQMNIEYMAKIIEIKYDLENGEADITIANTTDLLSDTEKLVQLLYNNSSASSLVQTNKYKWDKINAVQKNVISLLTDEWDATKQKIIAGVNNSVEVGNRGIIIRNPDFPDEIVIAQSGVIALSKDGGDTWKTAIKPDGIVAERLIGKIIAGQELIITNNAGTFTFDNNGVVIDASSFVLRSSSGGNMIEKFTDSSNFVDEFRDDGVLTPYEKKMTKIEWEKMLDKYNANSIKIAGYFPDQNLQFINDYHTRKQELYNYLFVELFGDKALLADDNMIYSTRIDGKIFDTKFNNFRLAETELEKQLALRAKEMSDSAQKTADDAQKDIDGVRNDIVYKTELHSSNGFIFKNGIINTVFTVKVYRGKEDITSTLPKSAFIWIKRDKDGNIDTAWNNAHIGLGKQITVTGADVYQKATFECQIDIPD